MGHSHHFKTKIIPFIVKRCFYPAIINYKGHVQKIYSIVYQMCGHKLQFSRVNYLNIVIKQSFVIED